MVSCKSIAGGLAELKTYAGKFLHMEITYHMEDVP